MSLADFLTILRLVLVPFFLFCFLKGNYFCAFVLFSIAGFTDLVDGTIARLLKTQTRVGAMLDPIADKALMLTTVTCLLILKIIPLWFFLMTVTRDMLILGGLGWLKFKKIRVSLKPVWSSKFGTLSNIIMVIFGFLAFLRPDAFFLGEGFQFWFHAFLWSSAALIVVSGFEYAAAGLRILRRNTRYV
ncbi:MAG: CDP-alcohol phosphatidyltransferase family protein [Deltaproteobacteria bacterium]|nr:CDP-alcohol phosphatidyltransferase family protein [Deltaproteobacteria bacterium]MDZ4224300.1 CDP-alcohol phosphatidyltransferase family protein [bacterium]